MRGLPIPRYPTCKHGPAGEAARWSGCGRSRRPDVVHIVTEGPLGWSALQAAEKLKLPVVSDFRTNFHAYSAHYGVGWLKKPILAYLRKFHNRTLVHDGADRGDARASSPRSASSGLRVIARGVDTRAVRSGAAQRGAARELGRRPGRPGAALRRPPGGGEEPGRARRCLRGGARRAPTRSLVLVGDGPARARCRRASREAVFAGTRSGEDLAAHYASADLFLFPSLTETFGNVTLEAMASGLAVVAFDYAGAAAVIRHGENGLLVPFGDGAAFGCAGRALAADPLRVRQLGAHARREAPGAAGSSSRPSWRRCSRPPRARRAVRRARTRRRRSPRRAPRRRARRSGSAARARRARPRSPAVNGQSSIHSPG